MSWLFGNPAMRPHIRLGPILIALCLAAATAACHTSYAYRARTVSPRVTASADHSVKARLRILVFGDSGKVTRIQTAVARGMKDTCTATPCDFGLVLGDNIYLEGVSSARDPKLGKAFHAAYDPLRLDLWMVPGNHDWYNDAAKTLQPAIDHTNDPSNTGSWRMPAAHYAVPRLPPWIHIYALDSSVLYDLVRKPKGAHAAELQQAKDAELADARAELCGPSGWKILAAHHFTYSNGTVHGRDSGLLAPILHPLIGDCGVRLFLAGHDHDQEHLKVKFSRTGGQYEYDHVIEGAAAEAKAVGSGRSDAATQLWRKDAGGFAILDVSPDQLTVSFFVCDEHASSNPCKPDPHKPSIPR